jgi:hypothetical protein
MTFCVNCDMTQRNDCRNSISASLCKEVSVNGTFVKKSIFNVTTEDDYKGTYLRVCVCA